MIVVAIRDNVIRDTEIECVICKGTDNLAHEHPCNVCTKGAWEICNTCIPKLQRCPICRKNFENQNTSNINTRVIINHRRNNRITNDSICIDMYKALSSILKIPFMFFLAVYIGKGVIYLYCTGTCPSEYKEQKKDCTCDEFAKKNNYWVDFRYFMLDLLVAIMLFSCCCIKNR